MVERGEERKRRGREEKERKKGTLFRLSGYWNAIDRRKKEEKETREQGK